LRVSNIQAASMASRRVPWPARKKRFPINSLRIV
jgi:hypothetical protein